MELIASDRNNIVSFIESQYLLTGQIPTNEDISKDTYCSIESIEAHLKSPELLAMLEKRGISLHNGLTPEMLAVANVLLDFSDRRSKSAKLAALGISTQKYNGFVKNRHFNEYVTKRAEQLLPDSMHEAHTALLKNVERGEVQSLKLYYEMTGRHVPVSAAARDSVNVEQILSQVFDVIVRHVKDPDTLRAISEDFAALAAPVAALPMRQAQPAIQGEILSI